MLSLCEWELNPSDNPTSVPCKPISAITSLATTDKQNVLIIIQANVVMISTKEDIQGQQLVMENYEGPS